MFPRAWTERLRDILDAIAEIETFTQGMAFDAFRNDPKTIRAVELDFMIIGEAANHVPETIQAAHPELSWHLMRALRNRLVHVYFSVDPKVVWDTIHNDLPPLIPLLESLLRKTCP